MGGHGIRHHVNSWICRPFVLLKLLSENHHVLFSQWTPLRPHVFHSLQWYLQPTSSIRRMPTLCMATRATMERVCNHLCGTFIVRHHAGSHNSVCWASQDELM